MATRRATAVRFHEHNKAERKEMASDMRSRELRSSRVGVLRFWAARAIAWSEVAWHGMAGELFQGEVEKGRCDASFCIVLDGEVGTHGILGANMLSLPVNWQASIDGPWGRGKKRGQGAVQE